MCMCKTKIRNTNGGENFSHALMGRHGALSKCLTNIGSGEWNGTSCSVTGRSVVNLNLFFFLSATDLKEAYRR